MKIKNNKTGEIIEVNEKDLGKYGITKIVPTSTQTTQPVINQPVVTQPVQTTQTTQPQSIAGNALDFITNLIAPRTKNLIQDIKASGQTEDYIKKMTSTGSAVDLAKQIQEAKQSGNQELLNQLLAKSKQTQQTTTEAPEFSTDTQKAIEKGKTGKVTDYLGRGLGIGTELGSLLTPMLAGKLGTVSKITSPVLDTGLKAGATTGALYGATNPEDTLQERLTGGLIGGATGAATGALLDKITGLKKTGENIQTQAMKPDIRKSPASATAQKEAALKIQQDYGITGNAANKQYKVGQIYQDAMNKVDDLATQSNFKTTPDSVNSIAKDSLKGVVDLKGANKTRFDLNTEKLKNLVDNNGNISAKALQDFKISLSENIKGGANVSDQKAIDRAFSNAADKLVKDNVKGASEAWKTMADMNNYSKVANLQSQIQYPKGINILGNQVGGGLLQTGKDITGRTVSGVGSATEKIQPANVAPLLQNILLGQRETAQPEATTTVPETTVQTTQPTVEQPTTQTTTGKITKQQYETLAMMDMIKTGGKNLTKLQTLYKITNPEESLSAADQKRKTALDSAESVYNQVYDLALSAPTGVKGYTKATLGKLPGVEGGSAEDLQRVTDGLAKAIAGAMAGEVGVATDKDVERWKGLMPKITDTMEERKRVLSRLKKAIDEGRKQFSTTNNTDILQGITQ